jgi:hypothetical protein
MNSAEFIAAAERDACIAEAIQSALYAMALTTGNTIIIAGVPGKLSFGKEMAGLSKALQLLGIDATEMFPHLDDGERRF